MHVQRKKDTAFTDSQDTLESIRSISDREANMRVTKLLDNYKVPKPVREQIEDVLVKEFDFLTHDRGLDKNPYTPQFRYFLYLLMAKESQFKPDIKNSLGCIGLFQLFPKYSKDAMALVQTKDLDLFKIEGNVRTWFALMELKEKEKGNAPWFERPLWHIAYLTNVGSWPKENPKEISLVKIMAAEHVELDLQYLGALQLVPKKRG